MCVRNRIVTFLLSILIAAFPSAGITGNVDSPINLIPMYGYPEIEKPERLKKVDEAFIATVVKDFGTRERASIAMAYYGWESFRKGDLEMAMRRFNQSWLLNQKSYLPHWGFGSVLSAQGKPKESIIHFEESLRLIDEDGEKARLLNDTARAYTVLGSQAKDSKKAEMLFEKANKLHAESERLDPQFGSNYRTWGISLYLEGKHKMAWEKIKKARALKADPLPPKMIKTLNEEMPVSGIHWSKNIIGTYKSEIVSGKSTQLGVTKFNIDKTTGKLVGSFSYNEGAEIEMGVLSLCTEIKREHALSCSWEDKYGWGMLVMDFSEDLSHFDGYWNMYGSLHRLPWNGKREPK